MQSCSPRDEPALPLRNQGPGDQSTYADSVNLIYGSIDSLRFAVRDIGPFESLRMIASTGAVLTAPMFEWVQEAFGPEKQVVSSSGGTDVCAACESVFTLVYQMARSLTR